MTPLAREDGESRRERILAAARKVFREKGYDRTTVSDVVHEAGVAQGTFYLYFPSKKDAFLALARQLPELMTRAVMGAADPALPFDERIRRMTRAGFECCQSNEELVRLIKFGADSIAAEVQAEYLKSHPLATALAEMFTRDMERGEIDLVEPEITARLILGMYENAFVQAADLGDQMDEAKLEKALSDLVIRALKRRGT